MNPVYTVKFHFPYATITVNKAFGWQIDNWRVYLRTDKHFEVEEGSYSYYINPALVTYMEVHEYQPF